jgi:hypothetical protein
MINLMAPGLAANRRNLLYHNVDGGSDAEREPVSCNEFKKYLNKSWTWVIC